ncbi:MAG: hypothetical protein R3192_06715 [Woeseiaceae bacterium]|nr:hypothetical protein [Woeseiaceae bacterium]
MKAKTTLKSTLLALTAGLGLTLLGQPQAEAHGIDYRPGYVYSYPGYIRAGYFPYWLRHDRGFQRWYWHSHYRLKRHRDWHRLYHLYLHDRRYRHHVRRIDERYYRGHYRKRHH